MLRGQASAAELESSVRRRPFRVMEAQMGRKLLVPLVGLLGLFVTGAKLPGEDVEKEKGKADPRAVARAKKTVEMLDDIYKTTIVLITERYVKDRKDFPPGRAAIKLFSDIS